MPKLYSSKLNAWFTPATFRDFCCVLFGDFVTRRLWFWFGDFGRFFSVISDFGRHRWSLGAVTNHPHLRAPCFVCPFMMAQSVTHVPAWRRPNERALSGFSTRLWDNSAPQNCSSQSQSFQYIGTLSQWLYEPIYTGLRQKPPEINSNLQVTENVLLFKTGSRFQCRQLVALNAQLIYGEVICSVCWQTCAH